MQKYIRTFVAIKIEPEYLPLEQLRRLKTFFENEKIRWVKPDDYHVTLRFIGNTSREQLYTLVDKFDRMRTGYKNLQLEVSGISYFKRKGIPQVLYANVNSIEGLRKLVHDVEQQVEAVGFHKERKEFVPHITLGRIKHLDNQDRFVKLVNNQENEVLQKVKITEFALYQSILRNQGPIYKTIKTFKLQ